MGPRTKPRTCACHLRRGRATTTTRATGAGECPTKTLATQVTNVAPGRGVPPRLLLGRCAPLDEAQCLFQGAGHLVSASRNQRVVPMLLWTSACPGGRGSLRTPGSATRTAMRRLRTSAPIVPALAGKGLRTSPIAISGAPRQVPVLVFQKCVVLFRGRSKGIRQHPVSCRHQQRRRRRRRRTCRFQVTALPDMVQRVTHL